MGTLAIKRGIFIGGLSSLLLTTNMQAVWLSPNTVNNVNSSQATNKPNTKKSYNNRRESSKYHDNISDVVTDISQKLLKTSRKDLKALGDIVITSFVDLNRLHRTSNLGRVLSENLYYELFAQGFNVSDFRGQQAISINKNGEYFLSRDVRKLNKNVKNKYILVGTFSLVDKAVLVNARIIDNKTGHIVAAARSYYNGKDCRLLGTCKEPFKLKIVGNDYKKMDHNKQIVKKDDKVLTYSIPFAPSKTVSNDTTINVEYEKSYCKNSKYCKQSKSL